MDGSLKGDEVAFFEGVVIFGPGVAFWYIDIIFFFFPRLDGLIVHGVDSASALKDACIYPMCFCANVELFT